MLEDKLLEISPWKRDSHLGYLPMTLISFSDPMTSAAFAFDSMVALTAACPYDKQQFISKLPSYILYVPQIISHLKEDENTSFAILSLSRPKTHYDILLKKQVIPFR